MGLKTVVAYLFMFYLWLFFHFCSSKRPFWRSFFLFLRGEYSEETQLSTRGSHKKKYVVIAKKPYNLIVSMALMNFSLEKNISDGYVWHFDCMACDRRYSEPGVGVSLPNRGKPIWTNIFERRIKSSTIQDFVDFLRHFEVGNAFFFEACSGFLWTLHIVWVFGEGKFSTSEHRFSIYTTVYSLLRHFSWIWRVYDDMNQIQCVIKVFACWLCDMNMQLYIDALWTISSIDFKFISETVSIESSRSIIHIELRPYVTDPVPIWKRSAYILFWLYFCHNVHTMYTYIVCK